MISLIRRHSPSYSRLCVQHLAPAAINSIRESRNHSPGKPQFEQCQKSRAAGGPNTDFGARSGSVALTRGLHFIRNREVEALQFATDGLGLRVSSKIWGHARPRNVRVTSADPLREAQWRTLRNSHFGTKPGSLTASSRCLVSHNIRRQADGPRNQSAL